MSADVRVVAAAFPEILAGRLRSLIAQQSRKKSLRNPFVEPYSVVLKEYFARLIDGISKLQDALWENW